MKTAYRKYILGVALGMLGTMASAQTLNSAYFTNDFKYRHMLNPAFGNEQNYVAIPALGHLNLSMQGNIGVQDVLFQNPQNGRYDRTFMHPDVSTADALANLNDENRLQANIDITLLSAGFRAFGGYNTIEVNERSMVALTLPYELFAFAKNIGNQDYEFGTIGMRALSYAEVALGHSHQINDNLRIGAKVKMLLGVGRADLSITGMRAQLMGNRWLVSSGEAVGEVNVKGLQLKNKRDDYKQEGRGSYEHVDLGESDVDGGGLGGFGLGMDLGAEYSFKALDIEALKTLKLSAAITDLGFISWSNSVKLTQKKATFQFDGFHEIPARKNDENGNQEPNTISKQWDKYADQLSDFVALQNEGDQGGSTTGLAATVNVGAEYALPMYEKLSFGLLGQHRFMGDYSWTEGRLSANWSPLSWLNGGMNVAVNTFATSAGWVLNVHPKGINFFVGMDHILGKQTKEGIPLSSNFSFNVGFNVAWGGSKK